MRRALTVTIAVVAVASLAAGCGSKPKSSSGGSTPAAGKAFNACMVLDTGGIDDRSFNQTSYAGMKSANQANPNIKISYVPSNTGNDYEPNLQAEVAKGCGTIIAVGGLMGDALKKVAAAHPTQKFAEVDNGNQGLSNIYGLQYNTAQGAFLGGYLAAGMSKSGKVATFGGAPIPPVTIYMDGFWEGVQYYNKQKSKNVQVLGWDEKNQKGGTFSGFNGTNKAQSITQAFYQQGADVVLPVAGGAGLGAAAAAKASGGKLNVIWVDTDGCESAAQYCPYFISSVLKDLGGSVNKYVTGAAGGTFPTGSYVGTLSDGGTGLAPFHDFQSKVPSDLQAELTKLKADIISGAVTISSPSQPKA